MGIEARRLIAEECSREEKESCDPKVEEVYIDVAPSYLSDEYRTHDQKVGATRVIACEANLSRRPSVHPTNSMKPRMKLFQVTQSFISLRLPVFFI